LNHLNCSHQFNSRCAKPMNWAKMLARFVSNKDISQELIDALRAELRHLDRPLRKRVFDYMDGLVGERGQNLAE